MVVIIVVIGTMVMPTRTMLITPIIHYKNHSHYKKKMDHSKDNQNIAVSVTKTLKQVPSFN